MYDTLLDPKTPFGFNDKNKDVKKSDYEKLRKKFKEILENMSDTEIKEWLEMDKKRLKESIKNLKNNER